MAESTPARAAFFVPALSGGGAELNMVRLAAGFALRGIETQLVVGQLRGPLVDQVPDSVRIFDLDARQPAAVTKTIGLARYLAAQRPELLVSALDVVNTAFWARRMARTRTRIVLSVRTHLSQQFRDKPDRGVAHLRRQIIRLTYPRVDAVVAVSAGVAEDLLRIAPVPEDRLHVIYNPVFTPDLPRLAEQPTDEPWLERPEVPVVIGSGRLVRQKDFPTLVRAFAALRRRRPARLILLGEEDPREPGERQRLLDLAAREGVADDVRLCGFVPNPHAYVARSAVFALSSAYEGFGNVVAEALAVGTPVVATDCPSGPAEILDHGRFGRLVPVGDADALAAALDETLAAPPDPERLRERAESFRQDRIVQQYLDVLGSSA